LATYRKNTLRWRQRESPGIYGTNEAAKEAHWQSLTALKVRFAPTITAFLPRGDMKGRGHTFKEWSVEFEDWIVNSTLHNQLLQNFVGTMKGRKTMIGKKGYVIAAPKPALNGDLVCILLGRDVPVVLQKHAGSYRLVGECYCSGIMKGKMMEALDAGTADLVEFKLH